MFKFLLLFLLSSVAFGDTPAPTSILALKAGSAEGVITGHLGIVGYVSPGASGNCLKSNGTVWISSNSCGGGGGGAVDSVNGQTGVVVLTTADISESGALYFTNTRARLALSASAPISYNNSTGVFSIPVATSSANGYLSSSDWTLFNAKEPAISVGTSGQYWRGDKTFQTLDTLAVPENTNLYYTAARFNTAFGAKSTSDLSEGTNLYFTQTRARQSLSASSPLSYDNSTGVFSLGGTIPIANGGTGQTTANNALNALLPSQSGHSGEVLTSDGTNTSWSSAGTGSVTNVTSTDGSIDITSPTTTPNLSVHFPMSAPGGSAGTPSYRFDSDTGMYSPSDGILSFSTNGVQRLRLENNGDINADGSLTLGGTIAASNYPPNNTANTPAYFDATGTLNTLTNWGVNPDHFGLFKNLGYSAPDGSDTHFQDDAQDIAIPVDAPTANATGYVETLSLDNSATSHSFGNIYMRRSELRLNGNGATNYSANLQIRHLIGNGSTVGTLNDGNGLENYVNIGAGFSVLGTYNLSSTSGTIDGPINQIFLQNYFVNGVGLAENATGLNLGFQLPVNNDLTLLNLNNNANVGHNYSGVFVNSSSAIGGDASMIGSTNSGVIAGNLNMFGVYNQSSGTVGGDFRMGQFGNDSTVANNSAGILTTQNGAVTKSHTGFGSYVGGPVGDGSGNNVIHFDASNYNATPQNVNGQIFGFNFNNNSVVLGNNNINGLNVNNQGAGYRFGGLGIFNQANMSEESYGLRFNNQGNFRTGSGIDINMSGNATDDVRGLRVNVSSQTSSSTANHVQSAEFQGGVVSVQGDVTPFNGVNVDIGNGFSLTSTIHNGSPLTGTDLILQLIQSSLIVNDDIATGPFGLDTNMLGFVSQVAVDTGKTVPVLRSALLGTSVPQGSGGTIGQHTVLTLLGLPSFGGSVNNPIRIGIEDGALLGQNFCLGATDCWFMKVQDETADNYLPKLSLGSASKKVSAGVKLEINDGHIKSTQTVAPVATVDVNAGTGATCVVTGTDTSGSIEVVAGAAAVSGSQCSVAFNVAYNSTPKCVLSPTSSDSGANLVGWYASKSTTTMVVNFGVADAVLGTYSWDYRCEE